MSILHDIKREMPIDKLREFHGLKDGDFVMTRYGSCRELTEDFNPTCGWVNDCKEWMLYTKGKDSKGFPKLWSDMSADERKQISFHAMSGGDVFFCYEGFWKKWDESTILSKIYWPMLPVGMELKKRVNLVDEEGNVIGTATVELE